MNRLFIALWVFCVVAAQSFAALGDYVSTQILPHGTEFEMVLDGDMTGGSLRTRLGLGPNNDPATGTPDIIFSWTTKGYDDTASAITPSWSAYGTIITNIPTGGYTITGTYTGGTFVDGEFVSQGTTNAKAIVYTDQSSGPVLIVLGVTTFPAPDDTHTWTGQTSSATFSPVATPVTYASKYIRFDGTHTHIRGYLSDYVSSSSDDSSVTVTALSGFITKSGTPNAAATAQSVTNNSTISGYPKVVGNDTSVPFQIISGATFNPKCVAFHSSARNGRPVACVKFTATDQHSHTVTNIQTDMLIDPSSGYAMPVPEYIGSISTSTLTALDTITVTWAAYPHRGNAASILDTNSGGTANTGTYGPKSWFNDKSGTYGIPWGVIAPSPTGNDATGVIYDRAITPDNSTNIAAAAPFETASALLAAAKTYNNSHNSNHNDTGGTQIYALAGTSYKVYGTSVSLGATPKTWPVIQPAPGVSRSQVVFDASAGDKNVPMMRWYNVTHTNATGIAIDGGAYLWFDSCVINPSSTAFVYSDATIAYYTNNVMPTSVPGTLCAYSSKQEIVALVAGNDLTNFDGPIMAYTVIGNDRTGTATSGLELKTSTAGTVQWDNVVIYCNRFHNIRTSFFGRGGTLKTTTHGLAFIQNDVEYTNTAPDHILSLAADGTGEDNLTDPNDNYLIWDNTLTGQRANLAYNQYGKVSPSRKFWSIKGNAIDDPNYKSEEFSSGIDTITHTGTTAEVTGQIAVMSTGDIVVITGVSPSTYNGTFQITVTDSTHFTYTMPSDPGANGTGSQKNFNAIGGRRGNWDVMNGVMMSGNMFLETTNIGAQGLLPRFAGLRTYTPASSTATSYMQFVDRKAYDGNGSATSGNGDYRVLKTSPAIGFRYEVLIRFGLDGRPRKANNEVPGAYPAPDDASAAAWWWPN